MSSCPATRHIALDDGLLSRSLTRRGSHGVIPLSSKNSDQNPTARSTTSSKKIISGQFGENRAFRRHRDVCHLVYPPGRRDQHVVHLPPAPAAPRRTPIVTVRMSGDGSRCVMKGATSRSGRTDDPRGTIPGTKTTRCETSPPRRQTAGATGCVQGCAGPTPPGSAGGEHPAPGLPVRFRVARQP